ncbi:uncharacterized protein LOC105194808 isoform X2 [Solenopsis invicta]|uniref:uncharacterized protein LOC105194808 isoform X2 n=1 Tax=Solenopsis invicta TaxID=13686 RepID=UPI00193E6E21|nr:uncharacterized protein LOC105194808 isoform X2 [Solenopsis invicta]
MEPVEFIAVKEEDNIDDLKIESNYFPFDLFEVEERKQELTDALKYCIDLLKDAQIILDLQNSNRTISKRSQLMGKEIQHRIMDMLDSMKFMDEEDEKMECQEDPMSFSLENSCDLNGKGLINDNIKSVEKDASLLNQSIECIDEDKSIILNNYENSVNSGSIKTVTSNEMPRQQRALKEKQRKTWDTEVVQLAINSVKSNKLSVRKASILFHVPGNTLQRLVDTDLPLKECVNVRGRKPLMPPEIEAQLVDYLLILENRFFGITINDVRMMTYQLAIRNNLKYPFGRKEKVGRAWFNRFIGRHSNLIIHKSSDDTSNFKTGFNKETVSAFFKILGNVYEEQNYNADRIFNVDAIGFNIIQCKIPQIVCLKGKRQLQKRIRIQSKSQRKASNLFVSDCSANPAEEYYTHHFEQREIEANKYDGLQHKQILQRSTEVVSRTLRPQQEIDYFSEDDSDKKVDYTEEQDSSNSEESATDDDSDTILSDDDELEQSKNGDAVQQKSRQRHFVNGKNGHKWCLILLESCGQHSRALEYMTDVKNTNINVQSPLDFWLFLFTNNILEIILTHTNEEIAHFREKENTIGLYEDLTMNELKAFIGLMYFSEKRIDRLCLCDSSWACLIKLLLIATFYIILCQPMN